MNFGYTPLIAGMDDERIDYSRLRDLVLRSERLGYGTVWINDHMNLEGRGNLNAEIFECWTLLSVLAAETRDLRLGTLVLCNPFRSPAVLAKMGATLDFISGGRLDLGIGIGWHKPEFEQYGIPFRTFIERHSMLEEALEVLKKLWTEKEATFNGEYYRLEKASLEPKPIQKPHPPIWIGGNGEKYTLRSVAKYADWWNAIAISPEVMKSKLSVIKRHCKDVGRDFKELKISFHPFSVISDDENIVKKYANVFRGDQTLEEYLDSTFMGAPSDIVDRIEEYIKLGVEDIQLLFWDEPSSTNSMDLFAEKVIPHFGD